MPARRGAPPENVLRRISDAVVPSQEKLTAYWHKTAPSALRYLGRRPLVLVRYVNGETFYHKGPLPPVSNAVHQLRIQKREGDEGVRLWVDSLEGLLGLVDIGVIELHPWVATVDDYELADAFVITLKPGPTLGWDFVLETGLKLRDWLEEEAGLTSEPKLTGEDDLHLVVPLEAQLPHAEAQAQAKRIADHFEQTDPEHYTSDDRLAERFGKLLVYARNTRTLPGVGPYSPRVRTGFPIAKLVSWQDVERGIRSDAFTMVHPDRQRARRRR
jgi:bifunctional non-homologous end joining protein LigD